MLHQRCNALENKNQRRELKIGQTHIIPWTRFANIAQRFGSLRSPTQWLLLTTDLTQRFGSLRSPPASFARIANIAQRFGSLRSPKMRAITFRKHWSPFRPITLPTAKAHAHAIVPQALRQRARRRPLARTMRRAILICFPMARASRVLSHARARRS